MGFRALATTSSGFAWSRGCADDEVPLDEALQHFGTMAAAVDVPVSGDFQTAFAIDPETVAANVALAAGTGIAGLSVEDRTGKPDAPLFDFALAVDRIRAARGAIDASGTPVVLTARSEGFLVGRADLGETIRRLKAFAGAGADCVYAPGVRAKSDISASVAAVSPIPVNVVVGSGFTTASELAALGVRRISVGGALARAAFTGLLSAAREIGEHGTFTALGNAVSFAELNGRE
jgi:methylisocitrate lyase